MEQLEFSLGEEKVRGLERGRPPAPAKAVGSPKEGELRIYLDRRAYRKMREYGGSDTSRELAGVLVGRACEDEKGPFVVVEEFIEAREARSHRSSVTFTHEAWGEIFKTMDERYPEKRIVGWFHTHPGFGVFLSGHDRFIHQHFFKEPWQVAYVLDPVAEEDGFFCWRERRLEKVGGFFVFGEGIRETEEAVEEAKRKAEAAYEVATSARRASLQAAKRRDVMLAVALALSVAALALSLVRGRPNLGPYAVQLEALRREVSRLSQEVEALRDVLQRRAEAVREAPAPSPTEARVYVVKEGDTLWGLALKFYGDGERYRDIAEANNLDPEAPLKPGMKIILPP